jgi:hypothetical protein
MKPTSKTVVPWLVRTTLSKVLYITDVCMKLFKKTSPKFGKLIGRCVSLLLNCIKKEDVSHENTRNLFNVSVGATSSMHLM